MQDKEERIFIKRKDIRKLLSKSEWFYNLEISIIICFVICFITVFLVNIVKVSGSSMEPTFHNKDLLLVSKNLYNVKNEDVIIINKQNFDESIIKRVIASEGQIVDIDFNSGDVFVDNKLIEEKYIKDKTHRVGNIDENQYPLRVPKDCYFVMGDNRNNSVDSRFKEVGMVKKEEIFGEVIFKIWG